MPKISSEDDVRNARGRGTTTPTPCVHCSLFTLRDLLYLLQLEFELCSKKNPASRGWRGGSLE